MDRNHLSLQHWHEARCSICGCSIDQENIASYLAISTSLGPGFVHKIQSYKEGMLIVGSITSYSTFRIIATSPAVRLIHVRCHAIFRRIEAHWTGPSPILISCVTPTLPVNWDEYFSLSDLDVAALITTFISPKPRPLLEACFKDDSLLHAISKLPYEISESIIKYCRPDVALAVASYIGRSMFDSTVKNDMARKRVTMCIESSQLLASKKEQTYYTEKIVILSERMKAIFVCLGGDMYLQSIAQESSCPDAVDFFIEEGQPEILALHVDHFGIRNIAFALDHARKPKWVRPDTRIHDIFLDEGKMFHSIRILSDPIKCRMIDIDHPSRNSLQPRPLLPCNLGRWAPLSINISIMPSFDIEGYIKPSFINLSILRTVYLSYSLTEGLTGIFTEKGENRFEILLGENGKRSIRLFGLFERVIRGVSCRGFSFLQIQTQSGQFVPQIDLTKYDVLEEEHHANIDGIWYIRIDEGLLFNVIYEFL